MGGKGFEFTGSGNTRVSRHYFLINGRYELTHRLPHGLSNSTLALKGFVRDDVPEIDWVARQPIGNAEALFDPVEDRAKTCFAFSELTILRLSVGPRQQNPRLSLCSLPDSSRDSGLDSRLKPVFDGLDNLMEGVDDSFKFGADLQGKYWILARIRTLPNEYLDVCLFDVTPIIGGSSKFRSLIFKGAGKRTSANPKRSPERAKLRARTNLEKTLEKHKDFRVAKCFGERQIATRS